MMNGTQMLAAEPIPTFPRARTGRANAYAEIDETTALRRKLAPLRQYLDRPGVIEVCVNKPGEVWVETFEGWKVFADDAITFAGMTELATAVATYTVQGTGVMAPLLSASLPSEERIQILQPPATPSDYVAVSLRKPMDSVMSLSDLEGSGLFMHAQNEHARRSADDERLLQLKEDGRLAEFLRQAVLARKTIVLAGATGSGKTTMMKALAAEIPANERLITIEDALELKLPKHPNKVNLLYSKGRQNAAKVTADQLLEACMRLRPDRVLLAEIRGEEAFSFLDGAASGHPGSITTVHAGSCDEAFERIALLTRKSGAGGGLSMPEIKQLAYSVIDVVVHFARVGANRKFAVTGVHYAPKGLAHGGA
ncbi:P-type DNA transfer ATPase VirB11 [Aquincola sp. S2]|uniref:Type IV secretion system protein n=1 Tax=Pseudaquabacterium terrae TaxID=2732868 RepID=A0ABX2ES80_9BURK|nr:P-type DNA transfer ATPase VirB11 [Aquabacterium terrae]NRF71377.1 P-type DNA transfer ATPase VirB11 [Aquabacterium terrae]